MLDDGAAGLWAVKTCGGVTVVQEPGEALYQDMPAAALRAVEIDHCLPAGEIGALLARLAKEPVANAHPHEAPPGIKAEVELVQLDGSLERMREVGHPSVFTCPSCCGMLWEVKGQGIPRFRCHVGHAYSAESLLSEQSAAAEEAFYTALRALEQKAAAAHNLAERMATKSALRERYEATAGELDEKARILRRLLSAGM